MSKKILIFLIVFFSFFPAVHAIEISTWETTDGIGIFSILEKINKEKTALSELEGQVDFEQQKIEENGKKIDQIDILKKEIEKLESAIIELEVTLSEDETQNTSIRFQITDKITAINEKIGEYSAIINLKPKEWEKMDYDFYKLQKKELENAYATELKKLSEEVIEAQKFLIESETKVKTIDDSINKSQIAFQIQVKWIITKIIFFVVSFLILFFGAKFLQNSIRGKTKFSEEKKEVLSSIVKWTKNTLIFSVIVFFFFSEFLTILPFLAILGTALWFALRDVISSFIAWFIIGLKDGIYGVGDVIEIEEENVFWRIIKITPLITQIQELGLSGPNGMYRSFPNKKIFERSIKNIWKQKWWIFISTDFLLEAKSDVILAKKILLESMNAVAMQDKFTQATAHKTFLKKFGHADEALKPQVFLEIRPQWILLRWKIPVMWWERHMMRTEVVERFVDKIRKTKGVDFRFVDLWGGFMNGRN